MSGSKSKVVITGGTGLLAANLASQFKSEWNIKLTTRNSSTSKDSLYECLDLLNLNSLIEFLNTEKPDFLINAAGMTSVEQCESNYYQAYEANALTAKNIAQACKSTNTKLIHISTDHFSPGAQELSNEESIGIPLNHYAKTKLDGEYFVQSINSGAIIVRTNFYGWGHQLKKSFSDVVLGLSTNETTCELFEDVFFTPVHTSTLGKNIQALVEKGFSGIINICGKERISKHEFGTRLLSFFGHDSSLAKKGRISDRENLTQRPTDMSLDSSKVLEVLGPDSIPSLEEEFSVLKEEIENGIKEEISKFPPTYPKRLICYGRQNIEDSDFEAVMQTLGSDWLTQGPKVQSFEDAVAKYVGSKYAVAICNWTCGLHISCLAAGVGPGDAIVTSPLSFVASSNSAIYCGATPLFADIDPETLNISPESIERLCSENKNVKAIMPVHFGGLSCDMEKIKSIADKYGVKIIEDAAHALGGTHHSGEKIGSCALSDICGFSFHPVKNITTGEGAVITTNDEDIYRKLLRLRSHGINKFDDEFAYPERAFTNGERNYWYHEMQELGYNYRITDLQCSLGLSQLNRIDTFHKRRVEIAKKYDSEFSNFKNLTTTQSKTRESSGNHLYILKVDFEKIGKTRFQVYSEINEKYNIGLHLHYLPIPLNPYYEKNFDIPKSSIQNSIDYYQEAVTIPIYPGLGDAEVEKVIQAFKEVVG